MIKRLITLPNEKRREGAFEGKILVTLSGGADSVALLRMLHEQSIDIEALHCNFHLRNEESDRDQHFVEQLCQRLQIPLHVHHFDTRDYATSNGISIEMAARQLRYQWFEEMRQQLHADYIAVAHHQDDQAETLLLNLIRGTGLRGLAAMSPRNGYIIRPLLDMSKHEILQYLTDIHQDYVTDSSNLEHDALRNRLRLDIIPQLCEINPRATQHIAEAAKHVREALPYYFKGIEEAESTTPSDSHSLTPSLLHERLQGLGFTPAQEADMLSCNRVGACFESPTHRATFHNGQLLIEEKSDNPKPALTTRIVQVDNPMKWLASQPKSPDIAYLDSDTFCQPLTLRRPHRGERFQPLGMNGKSRLLSDFLTDLHLNIFEKQRQWLLCQSTDQILWVIGRRIDHRFRITPATRNILIVKVAEERDE